MPDNEDRLINNIEHYNEQSHGIHEKFGGPPVYFHIQSIIEQRENFLSDRHIEMIYATLVSWGMHKLGNSHTKMVEFDVFKQSITDHRSELEQIRSLRIDSCTPEEYACHIDRLKGIFCTLKVSKANQTIVAHSKTLAHILPNLIPPIDNRYTKHFFNINFPDTNRLLTKFRKNTGYEFGTDQYNLQSVLFVLSNHFDIFKEYVCKIKRLFDRCYSLYPNMFTINNPSSYNMSTSYPKIMDNLIIAFVRAEKK